MRYPIAIETGDTKHAYGVVVPDLPVDQILKMAVQNHSGVFKVIGKNVNLSSAISLRDTGVGFVTLTFM